MTAPDGQDLTAPEDPTDETEIDDETVVGDHPDPVVLTHPDFDSQGLLRWGSTPT